MIEDTELQEAIENEVRILHEELITLDESESERYLLEKYVSTIAEGK